MDLSKQYVSVRQAAKIRGVSRQAILESLNRGTLKGTQIDRFWLIHRRDLQAFKPHPGGGMVKKKRKTKI